LLYSRRDTGHREAADWARRVRDYREVLWCVLYTLRTTVEHHCMQHNSDFYREEAAKYRELAEMAKDAAAKLRTLGISGSLRGDRRSNRRSSVKRVITPAMFPRSLHAGGSTAR